MKRFEVIEDNAGGLELFIFEGEEVRYAHAGYENNPGQLTEDLKALRDGDDDLAYWDGCEEDPQGLYDELLNCRENVVIIDNDGFRLDSKGDYTMGEPDRTEFGAALDEAAKIADQIKTSDTWNDELNRRLCELASLGDEYDKADGENFEGIVSKAADRLGVEIF